MGNKILWSFVILRKGRLQFSANKQFGLDKKGMRFEPRFAAARQGGCQHSSGDLVPQNCKDTAPQARLDKIRTTLVRTKLVVPRRDRIY